MHKLSLATLITALAGLLSSLDAAVPNGYYTPCEGKSGAQLLQSLCEVVGPHEVVSYSGLWELYRTTDVDAQGRIWDMYSTKRWTVGAEQCGSYSSVGDCYNREHSFPKSWFNDASPMYSDAFHIYPTDGKVNGQRSNYPYGECASGSSVSANGSVKPLGKLGQCTFPGYSGTVFEPDDEYKGDFARSYFYMAAAYNDRIAGWESDMLAGNAYPAFATWSVNLLLKWHRQDPVSDKEINRNEAVYAAQHNRNPFIDCPELVEYVWGNKVGSPWSSSIEAEPELNRPVEGDIIDIGTISAGVTRYYAVYVRGSFFTEPLQVSVAGAGFSTNVKSIDAASVNRGTTVQIAALSGKEGEISGTLTLYNSSISRTVALKAKIINGLPALEAIDVTESSFVARWVNIDNDEAVYTIHAKRGTSYLPGFPKEVMAEEERLMVSGLEPETTYTYYVTNFDLTSNTVSVTTASLQPSITLRFEGDAIELTTTPSVESAAMEIDAEIENIPGDVTVSVNEPFALSTDKSTWSTRIVLTPGTDNFYIHLLGDTPGVYTSTITCTAGSYVYDDVTATGTIRSTVALEETFESATSKGTYTDGTWEGVTGQWYLTNCGVYEADNSVAYEGQRCARMGTSTTSSLAMDFDWAYGMGAVSFMARPWPNDNACTLVLEYSTDSGDSWTEARTYTIEKGAPYTECSASLNVEGPCRLRIRQSAGKRVLIDNIKAGSFSGIGAIVSNPDGRTWDAYCLDGGLRIETQQSTTFAVYSIEGSTVWSGNVTTSATTPLPAGLYIVVSGDAAKRVVVK